VKKKLLALPSEALAKEGCWLLVAGVRLRAQGSGHRAQGNCQLPVVQVFSLRKSAVFLCAYLREISSSSPLCLYAFTP
jgi:hypothetical protein